MTATAQAPSRTDARAALARGTSALAGASRRVVAAQPWLLPALLATLVYGALAVALYWPVPPWSNGRLLQCGCADPALDAWFIGWTPHALLAHVSPLFTNEIEFPLGMNLATNTWMPLLGLLAAPVTLTVGPVASVNLLLRLAFVLSALSMYAVLGRFVASRRAAFVGGLFYGFSPYMIGQGSYHLNLVFVPIPPLILACLDELLVVRARNPYRVGLALGACCAAQYFVSVEVLADTALLAAVAGLVLAARHPRATWRAAGYVLRSGMTALAAVAVLCGYPIWYELYGRQHIGYTQAFGALENYNADLLGTLLPTVHEVVGPQRLIAIGTSYSAGNLPEDGSYLGITLLVVLAAALVVLRRNRLLRFYLLLALVADSFTFGRSLAVNNHPTAVPMPFELLWGLPLFSSELPARYSLLVDLFVAVALALVLDAVGTAPAGAPPARLAAPAGPEPPGREPVPDALVREVERWGASLGPFPPLEGIDGGPDAGGPGPEGVAAAAGVRRGRAPAGVKKARSASDRVRGLARNRGLGFWLLAAFVLFPLAPRLPYSQPPTQVPTAFLDSSTARSIPLDSVVLTYPFDAPPWNYALLWQASAGFPFKLIGGYGVTPNPGNVDYPTILEPLAMYDVLEGALDNGAGMPPYDQATFAAMRSYVEQWSVAAVIDAPLVGQPALAARYLDAALGRGTNVDGVEVWLYAGARALHLQRDPAAARAAASSARTGTP